MQRISEEENCFAVLCRKNVKTMQEKRKKSAQISEKSFKCRAYKPFEGEVDSWEPDFLGPAETLERSANKT
jgi:hypothetical protein